VQLVEAVAEADEELLEKYLEGEELTEAEIKRGLREGTMLVQLFPSSAARLSKTKGYNCSSMPLSIICPHPRK